MQYTVTIGDHLTITCTKGEAFTVPITRSNLSGSPINYSDAIVDLVCYKAPNGGPLFTLSTLSGNVTAGAASGNLTYTFSSVLTSGLAPSIYNFRSTVSLTSGSPQDLYLGFLVVGYP